MECILVLDTCVLIHATDDTNEMLYWDAHNLLVEIWNKHSIAMDSTGEIRNEYDKHLACRKKTYAGIWFYKKMVRLAGKINYLPKTLSHRCKCDLLARHFHINDIKFIAVANNNICKKFVTADTGLMTDEIIEYLEGMSITLLKVDECNELLLTNQHN